MAAARRVVAPRGTQAATAPRRRFRRWRYLPLALLLLGLLELATVWWLARWLGVAWVIVIALVAVVAGLLLVKREGPRAWRSLRAAAREGRVPAPEAVHGVLVLTAGLLLLFPGLLTDVVAIVLLLPPVSGLLSRRAARKAHQGVNARLHQAGVVPPPVSWGTETLRSRPAGRPRGDVVEGEIIEE